MADKRNQDSGERKFRNRSDKYRSERKTRSTGSSNRSCSSREAGNRSPLSLTEEERREYRRRKARIKKRREAVRNVRILFACVALVLVFLVFKAFAGIFHFIEKSRTEQKGTIETIVESESLAESLTETVAESLTETAESAGEDNGLVLSGGRYIDPSKPMVALTFDDGPDVQVDSILMDELEKVNGRATFFVVGQRVEKFPEDIKNTVERGHEVANHSYDHDIHLSKKGVDYIRNEFDKTDQAVMNAAGVSPALVRLPGGNYSADVKTAVSKPLIFWSIDTEDWRSRDAEKTKQSVLTQVKDGDIVLMHALYLSTAEACKTIIPELTARGYQLVTVSEMIRFRGQDVAGSNGVQYKYFPPVATAETQASVAETTASVSQVTASTASSNTSTTKSSETKAKSSTESSKSNKSSTESSSKKSTKNSTESSKESTKATKSTKESSSSGAAQTTAERNPATAAPETSALAPANMNGAIDAEDPQ